MNSTKLVYSEKQRARFRLVKHLPVKTSSYTHLNHCILNQSYKQAAEAALMTFQNFFFQFLAYQIRL